MPPAVDEVHAHFVETKETYVDEKGDSKVRTNVACNHCGKTFLLRNVLQLICHLAAPSSGMGKDSACTTVTQEVLSSFRKAKCKVC
jgi:hypothetical protein